MIAKLLASLNRRLERANAQREERNQRKLHQLQEERARFGSEVQRLRNPRR